MPNVVRILRSTTAGVAPSSLVSGQIAINEADGKIFWLDSNGVTIRSATIKDLDAVLDGKVPRTSATGAANMPAGTTAQRPTGAAGQLRYNSTTGKFEGFGSAWGNIGGGASISDTAPSNPGAGDLWWNSSDGILYVYYSDGTSSQWVATDAGGEGQYVAYNDVGTVTTAMLANGAVTAAKLGANVVGNAPIFYAYLGANQTLSTATATKLQLSATAFDSNSWFNTSLYRYVPQVAGYYMINGWVQGQTNTAVASINIYKNGSPFGLGTSAASSGVTWSHNFTATLLYMNGATDYLELYGYQASGGNMTYTGNNCYMYGHLVRAA